MSAVLKASKIMRVNRAHPGVFARYHRGDPGLLDGLWNGIKGAVTGFVSGGPIGAVLGGTQGLAGQRNAGTNVGATIARLTSGLKPLAAGPSGPNILSPSINIGTTTALPGGAPLPSMPPMFADPTRGNTTQAGSSGTDWDMGSPANGRRCNVGYHWNKSGYFTQKYGWIPKGTVCVKNRKRNPLNPRAASRALSRLTSTRKAMKGIERLMNRIGGGSRPVRVMASGGRRKKGCGCR